jgi:hypothetical protein
MKTELTHVTPTGIGRRFAGVAAAALFGSAVLASVPTPASAFDIGGLVGTAIALQMGGHHGGYSHHGRTHVASRRDHESTRGNSTGEEKDARDVDVTPQSGTKVSQRGPSGPVQNTEQASVPDATANKMAADEPAFVLAR